MNPLAFDVYLLVVAGAHFAEAREVWSKLFQQSTKGHRDQHLGRGAQSEQNKAKLSRA